MHLKSLEMAGFKSFAEKTRLEFHPGVTAIVGPNGCGKSNVLDAIRWVLGEQSAKALRGGEMMDVIFNGTDSRKQVGMAEVAMTFTDCAKELGVDYQEVTIARRLFRDGTSEYELNRTGCRLRDIQQLFMDTGIGRSAYSIMEQGKIDKILSARPEDRREVFEEAAGITKFKSQKKEALRKLENTEANLVRLGDIIKEVKRQIGSLQRQAAKARRYKELFDELSGLELKLARHEFTGLAARIAELEERFGAQNARIGELGAALEAKEAALRNDRREVEELEQAADRIRVERTEKAAERERCGSRIALNEERLTALAASDENGRLEIEAAEQREQAYAEQVGALDAQLEEARRELENCRAELQRLNSEKEETGRMLAAAQADLDSKTGRFSEAEEELRRLAEELSGWDTQKRTFALRFEAAEQDKAGLAARLAELESEAQGMKTRAAELAAAREAARGAVGEAEKALRRAAQAAEEARRGTVDAEKRLAGLESRREVLASLRMSHEEYSGGFHELEKAYASGALPGGMPQALIEALEIDPGWEPAVRALLGDALEALVVEDVAAAGRVAAYLAGKEVEPVWVAPGRMPRVAWQGPDRPDRVLAHVRGTGAAREVAEALLGHAYAAEDFDGALAIKAALPHALVATRDGCVVTAEGVARFGRGRSVRKAMDRQAEEHAIREQAEACRRELEALRAAEAEAGVARAAAEARLAEARAAVTPAEEAWNAADRDAHLAARQAEETGKRLRAVEQELKHLGQADAQGDQRQALHLSRRREIAELRESLHAEIKALQGRMPEITCRDDALNAGITSRLVARATLEEKLRGIEGQREPVAARLADLRNAIQTRREEIEGNARKRVQFIEENETTRSRAAELDAETAELDRRLAECLEKRAAAQQRTALAEDSMREERREFGELQQKRAETEVELERHRMEAASIKEQLLRRYQIDLEQVLRGAGPEPHADGAMPEAGPVADPGGTPNGSAPMDGTGAEAPDGAEPAPEAETPPDWEEVRTRITELRGRLDQMGPVNVEAITEFEELEARDRFLDQQHADLINSKEQLLQAIQKINKTTRELFAETFEKVRENFQSTFTELFGGGKANLILADEEDPLECGIEIVARPPGKQLQSITLMSGGERTMTAVALLFAIYMVKPSPFCILDEMDAPLDESNINRFLGILKRFVGQSQFLLITHNKKTISFADALYGVTMEERGVSKIVSVRFARGETEREGAKALVPDAGAANGGGAAPAAA